MFSLIEFVFPLIFITAAHGLAPPSPSPATILPFSSLSSTLQLLNSSSTDDDGQPANATNNMVKCDGRQWGYDLDKASCEETWKKIPTDSHFFTYGARSRGVFDRPLPYRYLSDDGLCAVDIYHMSRVFHDTATNHEISAAAKLILDKCVFRDPRRRGNVPIGGYLPYVGNHRGLSVRVSSYSPDVRCTFDSKHEDENVCSKLLGILPISTYTFLFTREKKTEAKSVIIPPGGKKMSNAPGTCTAIIDFAGGDTDESSWIEMWAAAVAVNEMCVTKGKAGAAYGLGQYKRLMLSLSP